MLPTRRQFLTVSTLSAAGRVHLPQQDPRPPSARTQSQSNTPPPRKSDPLPDALVHEWVWRGHFDLDGVKRMLAEQPTLINATYDWGNGDYEMAIGGAGHLGRRDIAEYLLSQGSRMDTFVAAMLGQLDIVRATLKAYPTLITSRGPHGLTLLHHAQKGGDQARAVLEYLQSAGAR